MTDGNEKDPAAKPAAKNRDILADQRDESGGLIDPPVIPEFEARLRDAHDRANADDIQAITDEYTVAREERAVVLAERAEAEKNA